MLILPTDHSTGCGPWPGSHPSGFCFHRESPEAGIRGPGVRAPGAHWRLLSTSWGLGEGGRLSPDGLQPRSSGPRVRSRQTRRVCRVGPCGLVAGPPGPLAETGVARAPPAWTGCGLPGCGRPFKASGGQTNGRPPRTGPRCLPCASAGLRSVPGCPRCG